jgi:hypothetical protein
LLLAGIEKIDASKLVEIKEDVAAAMILSVFV